MLPIYHRCIRVRKPVYRRGFVPKCLYPAKPKTIGEHVRKRRMDLRLSQAKAASQIGVNVHAIEDWEAGDTEPHSRLRPAIIHFLGYEPES
jgi:DNA-binding transcriptional regulator YiaG